MTAWRARIQPPTDRSADRPLRPPAAGAAGRATVTRTAREKVGPFLRRTVRGSRPPNRAGWFELAVGEALGGVADFGVDVEQPVFQEAPGAPDGVGPSATP